MRVERRAAAFHAARLLSTLSRSTFVPASSIGRSHVASPSLCCPAAWPAAHVRLAAAAASTRNLCRSSLLLDSTDNPPSRADSLANAPSGSDMTLYYAVARGRKAGVYHSWSECEEQVKGFAGAAFKKFKTLQQAQEFIGTGGDYAAAITPAAPTASPALPKKHTKSEAEKAGASASSCNQADAEATAPAGLRPLEVYRAHAPPFGASRVVEVYTDGASHGNGTQTAAAGWGVYFPDPEFVHLSEARRLGGKVMTNNRAELMAIIRACQLCPDPKAHLWIYTDSNYCIGVIEKWQAKWRKNGWKTSGLNYKHGRLQPSEGKAKSVVNRDLIRRLEREMRERDLRPRLIKIKGHAGHAGNEEADRLAGQGARLPAVPESEWQDLEPSESEDEDGYMHRRAGRYARAQREVQGEMATQQATAPSPAEEVAAALGFEIDPGDLLSEAELDELKLGDVSEQSHTESESEAVAGTSHVDRKRRSSVKSHGAKRSRA